jgi:hypothetical protein
MKQITDFLKRFTTLQPTKRKVTEAFITVTEKRKIPITKETVKVNGGYVFITAHPAVKSEIFTQKEGIIGEVNTILGKKIVSDIR